MNHHTRWPLTRRQILFAAPAALGGATRREYRLRNSALGVSIAVDRDRVVSRRMTNRLTGQDIELFPELFALEFEGGRVLASTAMPAGVTRSGETELELDFSPPAGSGGPQVRVRYELAAGKPYLRKQVSVRQPGSAGWRLVRADLDNWMGVRRSWRSMTADRLPYGSHPIYCEDWWAGVEFVAAFNEYGAGGFLLRSRPGGRAIGPEWAPLRSTVVGVSAAGRVREAFLEYLEDIRLAPARMVACYNSWWTLPKVVRQRDNLALIRELKAEMHDRYGVFFDIVTTDMGWSNPRSIWEIDRSILPAGFDDIRAIVEPAGGKLGLWMSPSEQYPPVCDYDWAKRNGYAVLLPEGDRRAGRPAVSLADPRYRSETKAALRKLIRDNGLGHVKYDGFLAEEDKPHHGLLPGVDSVEPLADYSLELLKVSKEENAGLVTEPTYLNSHANYISPWILKYSDSVWGNAGGDCPPGLGPAPDYREAHTTARDYYVFASLNEVWLPQNALHYFDIVHADTGQGFPNHAAMAFARGRFFVSTYLNPKVMDEEDWRIYAGLLRWARANRETLRHTVVVPSRVELGEPYAYGHWSGTRGIVAVRNPSNQSQSYDLLLARAGAPRQLAGAVAYTQFPYRKGLAAGLRASSTLRLELAPWELLFIEIVPRAQLREPVAIGARWDASGMVPDLGVSHLRLLWPGGSEERLAVKSRRRSALAGKVLSLAVAPAAESDWLATAAKRPAVFPFHYPAKPTPEELRKLEEAERPRTGLVKVPAASFTLECTVNVPGPASRAELLLLIEFPGREHLPSECRALVDGHPAVLQESDSSGHVGYFVASRNNAWKDMLPHESQWRWYRCKVDAGRHALVFAGKAGQTAPRIGLWAWAEYDLSAGRLPLPFEASAPAMPPYRAGIEREGVCLKPPVVRPVE